ncbi:MAG: hypothetical protein JJU16_07090 [Alkalibacterium sp.]|nr:hypothetical protein [Alkalibacterium sp.]
MAIELEHMKDQIINAFNELHIDDLPEVKDLNELKGSFVNLDYTFPSGQTIKLWKDDRTYLGNELEKIGGDRCYGLVADEQYLLVCEYGENGTNSEIVVYKRWN